MGLEEDLKQRLRELAQSQLLRTPPALTGPARSHGNLQDQRIVVFCSNDYLGLSEDPRLTHAMAEALAPHGIGAGASRLVSGTHDAHRRTEATLADWVDRPSALLFSSGYAANVGTLSALLNRDDVVFSDRLNHASIIDGIRLSRAQTHIYDHASPAHLEILLRNHRKGGRRALIATDALFSMDGDLAPVAALKRLSQQYDAALYVDEAHSLGVIGEGRGWCFDQDVVPDVLVGTLGKATGVSGAFVAGTPSLRAFLENRARSYVFSTAIPPALACVIDQGARLARAEHQRRVRVLHHATRIRHELRQQGWQVPDGASPIVPVLIGDPATTMMLSHALLEHGYFVQGIRPPTVPRGTSRLRLVPTAAHTEEMVTGLLEAFRAIRSAGLSAPAAE